jgi:hypothetical protein
MNAKLGKSLALGFLALPLCAHGQIFVDFHAQLSAVYRPLPSSSVQLTTLPGFGLGIGARLRSYAVPSLELLLYGVRTPEGEELFWLELGYGLLLQLRYGSRPAVAPAVALELIAPLLPRSAPPLHLLAQDLRAFRLGSFAGMSLPMPSPLRYLHLLVGAEWFVRQPEVTTRLLPQLRLRLEGH